LERLARLLEQFVAADKLVSIRGDVILGPLIADEAGGREVCVQQATVGPSNSDPIADGLEHCLQALQGPGRELGFALPFDPADQPSESLLTMTQACTARRREA